MGDAAGGGSGFLALSDTTGSCANIDYNYVILPMFTPTVTPLSYPFKAMFSLGFIGSYDSTKGSFVDNTPYYWDDPSLEMEDVPRSICWSPYGTFTYGSIDPSGNPIATAPTYPSPFPVNWANGLITTAPAGTTPIHFRYTGLKLGVVFNCEVTANAPLNTLCTSAQIAQLPAQTAYGSPPPGTYTPNFFYPPQQFFSSGGPPPPNPRYDIVTQLTPLQRELRSSRTVCCKQKIYGKSINAGQCINPNVQSCCGAAAFENANQQCCNANREIVAEVDGLCPCGDQDDCPIGEKCCLATKYSEISGAAVQASYPATDFTTSSTPPQLRGQCYRNRLRCCDTGNVYEPGSHQCCRINGVQSINVPCPCNIEADCISQQFPIESRTYNFTCCVQTAVTPLEGMTHLVMNNDPTINNLFCSIYANYPSGSGAYQIQRCMGVCMDPRYQFCCNGAVCMKDYEKCCNSSCCNIWTSTCFSGLRSGSLGRRANPLSFASIFYTDPRSTFSTPEIFTVCSSIEALTTTKGFWIFVLPSMLLLVSHVGLALVLVFAAKATPRSFSKLEYAMMGLALLICYLVMPLYFGPVWKYPIWVIFGQLIVFLTATARIRWLNVLCIVVQAITLIYLFDPFHGNAFLTLSSNRVWSTAAVPASPDDVMTSGVLHAIVRSWHSVDLTATQQYCSNFYDYFVFDPNLRDLDRYDNGAITMFGYCSRGWVTALLMFSYFVMLGVLVQLVLSLLGLFYRFHTESILTSEEPGYYEEE